MPEPDDQEILPAHIQDTVRAISELHTRREQQTNVLQRVVDRSVSEMGRPRFVAILTTFFVLWFSANRILAATGQAADFPPLEQMKTAVEFVALYLAVLILISQRREDQIARLREQLTLELTILSEGKSAKIIELLEEMRRDNPAIADRTDEEAEAMAHPADPESVLSAIEDQSEDLPQELGSSGPRS